MEWMSMLLILAVVVLLALLFVRHMSATHDTFEKMGVETPQPVSRIFGNFLAGIKYGVFGVQTEFYEKFRNKKVYGWYDFRSPVLIVKDLDFLKDIFVKHFNCFVDRPGSTVPDPPLKDNLLALRGDHWKHVRSAVSPTFSSGRIKKMSKHIERKAKELLETLREKQERNEPVELDELCGSFTLDVIASTGFGLDINTLKEPKNEFVTNAKKIITPNAFVILLNILSRKFAKLVLRYDFPGSNRGALDYWAKVIKTAIENRKESDQAGKINDFIDLVINAEKDDAEERYSLNRSEIEGQALIFILAGYGTTKTVLSFTLFLLATNPECLQKAQDELKEKLGKDTPNYENVQALSYMDMCINESIRLFPPGFMITRQCTQDVDIQDVHIPKGMVILAPVYAIHRDPEIWPEPEKFDPERFSPDMKESRHPYAHLPFGQGPRNCIGMRLALLELKITLSTVLQTLTPVVCEKTVYPVKLGKIFVRAKDGLWVKFEQK